MKRDVPDIRLVEAALEARGAVRQAIAELAGRDDTRELRLLLGRVADLLTAGLKSRARRYPSADRPDGGAA